MFGSTAAGTYLVMMLLVMPLLQNAFNAFGRPTQLLFADTTRNIVYLYLPLACGLLATFMMRRNYIRSG
jgi:hypothetical protein